MTPGPVKISDALQILVLVLTVGGIIGGGFLAFATLRGMAESNRDDLLNMRTTVIRQADDLRATLKQLDERQRQLGEKMAEMSATMREKDNKK